MRQISVSDFEGTLNIAIYLWTKYNTKSVKECIKIVLKEYGFDEDSIKKSFLSTEEFIDDWSLAQGAFGLRVSYKNRAMPAQSGSIPLRKIINISFSTAKELGVV